MRSRRRPTSRTIRTTRTTRTLIGLITGVSLIAACGSDDSSGTDEPAATGEEAPATDAAVPDDPTAAATTPPATTPADTPPSDAPVPTIAEPIDPPERVVSLSPTHTEVMFAIGAGDQLVAVDDFSNYPAEALELPNELSGFEPNVEAIAGYEPDLVITGGDFTGLGDQLAALGIASWDGPAPFTVDEIFAQIVDLGEATGHPEEAAGLVAAMQAQLTELIENAPEPPEPLHLYHELDPTYYSIDSTTFIGDLYSLFGLRNIADEAEGDSGGYPQLNAEFIVSTDPELIFLADTRCCGESLATVSSRDGWDAITAVRDGAVIEMDDDIASRWGPRVVDYAAAVAAAITQVVAPA